MAASSNIQTIDVVVKMFSGDLFPIEIPSDITVKQFYEVVWRTLPERFALQSLDLLRDDSENPLPSTLIPLLPQQDEIFFAFIQTSHFTLRLDLIADAFHGDRLFHVFEAFIQESHPDSQESKTNPPSISPVSLPIDQNGNTIHPRYRYNHYYPSYRFNHYCPRFYTHTEQIDGEFIHTFYSDDEIDVFRRGRFGDEWEVEIPPEKQPLSDFTQILDDLPVSTRTLNLLQEEFRSEWNKFNDISRGFDIVEIPSEDVMAAFDADLADEGDDSVLGDWA